MALDLSISVLIVDDASTMAHIIRNLLRRIGFNDIDEAPGGVSALAKMKIRRYGLVISDWNMEPMSGIELLRQVRADPRPRQNTLHHGDGGIAKRTCHRSEGSGG